MKVSIAVFTAEPSMPNIQKAISQITSDCSFTFFPYYSLKNLGTLYSENAHMYDGILFSGMYPYQFILSSFGAPKMPHNFLEVTDRDYYKLLMKIFYQNPGIDISRIWLGTTPVKIPWETLFDGKTPQISYGPLESSNFYDSKAYDSMLNFLTDLWAKKKVDHVVTRLSTLQTPLKEAGIPFSMLLPSQRTIVEAIEKLIFEISFEQTSSPLSAFGILSPTRQLLEEEQIFLNDALFQFNCDHGMILILRKVQTSYEIVTSYNALYSITDEFTTCSISQYLREVCEIPFSLGWGIGDDLLSAQQNALYALNESSRNLGRHAFLMNHNNELIGPLAHGKARSIATAPDPQAKMFAKQYGISPTIMQKLLIIETQLKHPRFNRNELANYLNVSLRTANRVLTKLAEQGGAIIVAAEQSGTAGRPMAIYELNLTGYPRTYIST